MSAQIWQPRSNGSWPHKPIGEMRAKFEQGALKPSVLVQAGASLSAYYLIKGPCSGSQWHEIDCGLNARFDGHPTPPDLVLAPLLPGSFLIETAENGEKLYAPVRIIEFEPSRRYAVEQMREAFPRPMVVPGQ